MTVHPTASDLIQAVADWLDVLHAELNPRDAFLARVAINALSTARRDVEQGPDGGRRAVERLRKLLNIDGDCTTLTAELCDGLHSGIMDETTPGLLAMLKAITADQLAIDQPSYSSSS